MKREDMIYKWLKGIEDYTSKRGVKKIKAKYCSLRLKRECEKKNAYIPISAKIGENIFFPHGITGIFLSGGTRIGKNAVIFQQVTIGSNTLIDSKNMGSPTIGDNVYIGAGAKIIGNVQIGDNVRIGANCSVSRDVPSNCTVVPGENRIIFHNEKKDNRFFRYGSSQLVCDADADYSEERIR